MKHALPTCALLMWIGFLSPSQAVPPNSDTSTKTLTILRAIYGTGDANQEVTSLVAEKVKDNRIHLKVSNLSMGGDPAWGQTKRLLVEYELDGERLNVSIPEYKFLTIPVTTEAPAPTTDDLKALQSEQLEKTKASSAFSQSKPASPSTVSADPKYKEMVKVEGGRLKAAKENVKDFRIGKYEVTRGEWHEVVNWALENGYDLNASGSAPGSAMPFGRVSWFDVVKWCNAKSEMEGLDPVYYVNSKVYKAGVFGNEDWNKVKMKNGARGYRLPTVAEWEWAARGGKKSKGYTYAGSNNLDDVAWHSGAPQHVGSKQPNELGIYDMHGNIAERTWDFVNCGGSFRGQFTSQFKNEFQIPTRSQHLFNWNKCLDLSNGWDTHPIGFRVARDGGGL